MICSEVRTTIELLSHPNGTILAGTILVEGRSHQCLRIARRPFFGRSGGVYADTLAELTRPCDVISRYVER